MRFTLKKLFFATAVIAVIVALSVFIRSALAMRLVAAVDHPNGSRLRVVQKLQLSSDLFDTSIYFNDGDGRWRWYYFDHADWYWDIAETQVEQDIVFVRAPDREIVMDTRTGDCTISQNGDSRTYPKLPSNVILPHIQLPDGISEPPAQYVD